jgi:hypothetical protein
MTDFEVVRAVSLWGPWAIAAILVLALGLAALFGAALRRLGSLTKTGGQHSMHANGTSAQRVNSDLSTEVVRKAEDLSLENRSALCEGTELESVPHVESAGPLSSPECTSRDAAPESSSAAMAVGLQPRVT